MEVAGKSVCKWGELGGGPAQKRRGSRRWVSQSVGTVETVSGVEMRERRYSRRCRNRPTPRKAIDASGRARLISNAAR